MGGEWVERTIDDIATVVGGGTPSTKDPSNFDGDIPWLTPKDLSGNHPRYVSRGARNLSKKGLDACSARLLPTNTVLLSSRAPIGYVAIAANPIATNQGFRSLIVKDGYDHEFVYYWLKAHTFELERHASGSTFKELSGSALKKIRIRLPRDEDEQRAIARILGTLDDKIELNRRMNETLEAMAQALFKSWFVDFDPVVVHALKAGNPIPDKFADRAAHYRENLERLGLPEEILRLFPDRFVDSELGPIPEGWEVKAIGELAKCVGGATPSTKNPVYWEGGTNPFLTPKDMAALDAPVVLDTARHITDAGVERISSKRLPAGTVLLSSRAPIGYLAINEVPVSINQGIIAMICDGEIPNYYALFWAKNNMDVIKGKAGGTTFSEISKKNFRTIPALRPSDAILDNFAEITGAFYKQIVENAGSSVTLTNLRDTLLPKLISGELCVPDVEKILEDAL